MDVDDGIMQTEVQESTPQMQQIRMEFKNPNSNTPTPSNIIIELTEEDKSNIKVDSTPKQDSRSPTSLHGTYKNNLLKSAKEKYKTIDEVDEESKSSIYNKTNGDNHSRRQSNAATNGNQPIKKGSMISIQEHDTPKMGYNYQFSNDQFGSTGQSKNQSPDRINSGGINQTNTFDKRLDTIQEYDIANNVDSQQLSNILNSHQEDDVDRNRVQELQNKNLIDKKEQQQNQLNQQQQEQDDNQQYSLNNLSQPITYHHPSFQADHINQAALQNNPIDNDSNSIKVSRNEPELNLISKNYASSNNNVPAKFTIEVEHVSRLNSPSQQQVLETLNLIGIDSNTVNSIISSQNPVQANINDNNAYSVNDGTDSLVTDPMFKHSSATPTNDQMLYQNSLGNLTYKTNSEYQAMIANFQAKQENFDTVMRQLQQNQKMEEAQAVQNVGDQTIPLFSQMLGHSPVYNQITPDITPNQINNDQLQLIDEGFVSSPDKNKNTDQKSTQKYEDNNLIQQRDPQSPLIVKTNRELFQSQVEQNPLDLNSQPANDIDEKFNIEQQILTQQQDKNTPTSLMSQREIYNRNIQKLQHAQHDFLQEMQKQEAIIEKISSQHKPLQTTNGLVQSSVTYPEATEVDIEMSNNQGISNQDTSKKKKKKSKKKKKRGLNMTSAVDESQYEYTMVQDDVESDNNEPKSRKSMKSLKSLKNVIAQGSQEPLTQIIANQNDIVQSTAEDVQLQQQQNNQTPQKTHQVQDQQNVFLQQSPQQILDQLLKNDQLQNQFMPNHSSFDVNRQISQKSFLNLQQELSYIEQNLQNNLNQQTLNYLPPHMKGKKFRQHKVVSQEINSNFNVDPQVDMRLNNQTRSNIPPKNDSLFSQTQKYTNYRSIQSPNVNIQGHIKRIQDGMPHFNTSLGVQMNFQNHNSLSQTQLPQIITKDNSINLMKVNNNNSQIDVNEESKNEDLNDFYQQKENNLPSIQNQRVKDMVSPNNNINKSYYPNGSQINGDVISMHTHYQNSPPYTQQQKQQQQIIGDRSSTVQQFESINDNFVSTPGSRASSKISNRQNNINLNTGDMQMSPMQTQPGVIMPLQDQCKYHPKETIKYFCRDPACLKGLCPDCIIEHSKHDFLAANELAAFEIKQIVKQAQRRCKNQVKMQKELKQQTEKKLSSLNRQRSEEFHRLHCYFNELHRELDERENQLNQLFNDEIRETESQLMKDMQNIQQIYSENVKIFKRLKQLIDQQQISQDTAVVGNAEIAYSLNNLTLQKEQNIQNRVFYVQFEDNKHDIITPTFELDLNNEKYKIQSIGSLLSPTYDENAYNQRKLITERPSATFPSLDEAQNIIDNLSQQNSNSLPINLIRKSANGKLLSDAQTQTIEGLNNDINRMNMISRNSTPNHLSNQELGPQYTTNKNIYWFRWDSTEVYKLNPETKRWQMRVDIKNSSKFLFFSSIVHLTNEMGCFIVGGSDNENNFSKRVQYFCKYNVFVEKPPMINKRAFFPSIFSKLDNSIYVLGGSENNQTDLNLCEKFSLIENVWRPIAPMNLSRNGMGAIIIEQYRLIFAFGGNNHKIGSLNKIEKYEIDFDKWSVLSIQMKHAVHDLSAFSLGKERVLLFGGHTNTEPSKEMEMIDLSFECYKSKQGRANFLMKEGGKTYFPPFYDSQSGKLQLIFGYCDSQPSLEEIDVSDLVIGNSYIPQIQQISHTKVASSFNNERKSQSLTRINNHQLMDM